MSIRPTTETVRAALGFIPADDREIWWRVGMALKSEFGDEGESMFDAWSQTADNYDASAVKSAWRSFKSGSVTIGTLIREATQRGFNPKGYAPAVPLSGDAQRRIDAERAARVQHEKAETAQRHEAVAKDAAKVWAIASATGDSPYLSRKRCGSHGVRFDAGVLLVPVRDAGGKLWSLQRIASDGGKRFLSGGRVGGGFHLIGEPAGNGWLLVAEGYATAATLHEACGLAVAVAFNADNVRKVAAALRKKYPEARLLICADDDRQAEAQGRKNAGVSAASAAAKAVDGRWIKPEALPDDGTDFNDMALASGADAVRAQVMAVVESAEGGKASKPTSNGKVASTKAKPATNNARRSGGAYYDVKDDGVWHHGFDRNGDPMPPQWICSRMDVTAETRDDANGEWGYLLEFHDADGVPKAWAMPSRMLSGDGSEYRSNLLAMGLKIAPGASARTQLTNYIQTMRTEARARCTDRIGWHGGAFVLPDRTIGDGMERVIFQSSGAVVSQFKQRGTLEEWREHVAALCAGNSRFMFTVSAAFAGPLLHLAGVQSGGFHLVGGSSSGKTTALECAASVFGGKDYMRSWRATDNALELTAAQHSDAVLILDEIGQVDPKVVGDVVYMLANETGKGRASRIATARPTLSWRLLFLSDGEIGLADHMSEANKSAKAGQDIRLANIPADARKGYGALDVLHDFASSKALSDHLKSVTRQYYGTAGMAFIEFATKESERLAAVLKRRVNTAAHEWVPSGASGQVHRVATRFALAGVAGEIAGKAGITGWPQGDALEAARVCFLAWLDMRGGAGDAEQSAMLRQVLGFFEAHGAARFTWWHRAADDHSPNTINRAGFRRMLTHDGVAIDSNAKHWAEFGDKMDAQAADGTQTEYYVFSEVFRKEICKGFDYRAVARLLVERGALVPEGESHTRNERLPSIGKTRCYRITNKLFDIAA